MCEAVFCGDAWIKNGENVQISEWTKNSKQSRKPQQRKKRPQQESDTVQGHIVGWDRLISWTIGKYVFFLLFFLCFFSHLRMKIVLMGSSLCLGRFLVSWETFSHCFSSRWLLLPNMTFSRYFIVFRKKPKRETCTNKCSIHSTWSRKIISGCNSPTSIMSSIGWIRPRPSRSRSKVSTRFWFSPFSYVPFSVGPPYTLRLRVKFYSSEPNNLREELTRYQFFLQLKQDILTGKLDCPHQTAVELAALALQC